MSTNAPIDDRASLAPPLVREVQGPTTERGRVAGLAMVCSAAGVALGFALAGSLFAAMTPQRIGMGPGGYSYRYHSTTLPSGPQGWMGVSLDQNAGAPARVIAVVRNTPAHQAGFGRGDIITRVDGRDIETAEELVRTMSSYRPGDAVDLVVQKPDGTAGVIVDLRLALRPAR
jgi:S1-C subfamily serine protease